MATRARQYGAGRRRPRKPDDRRSCTERGYDHQWNQISRMYRSQHPLCEKCGRPADDVDHIEPFQGRNDPKRTEWDNLQALCRACHNVKTRGQGG